MTIEWRPCELVAGVSSLEGRCPGSRCVQLLSVLIPESDVTRRATKPDGNRAVPSRRRPSRTAPRETRRRTRATTPRGRRRPALDGGPLLAQAGRCRRCTASIAVVLRRDSTPYGYLSAPQVRVCLAVARAAAGALPFAVGSHAASVAARVALRSVAPGWRPGRSFSTNAGLVTRCRPRS